MPKAWWNGVLIADSDETMFVDGRHYFPPDSVKREYLQKSQTRTTSPRLGEATYYHLTVDGELNADAAWSYHAPKTAASQIKDFIAFWHGVEVE